MPNIISFKKLYDDFNDKTWPWKQYFNPPEPVKLNTASDFDTMHQWMYRYMTGQAWSFSLMLRLPWTGNFNLVRVLHDAGLACHADKWMFWPFGLSAERLALAARVLENDPTMLMRKYGSLFGACAALQELDITYNDKCRKNHKRYDKTIGDLALCWFRWVMASAVPLSAKLTAEDYDEYTADDHAEQLWSTYCWFWSVQEYDNFYCNYARLMSPRVFGLSLAAEMMENPDIGFLSIDEFRIAITRQVLYLLACVELDGILKFFVGDTIDLPRLQKSVFYYTEITSRFYTTQYFLKALKKVQCTTGLVGMSQVDISRAPYLSVV